MVPNRVRRNPESRLDLLIDPNAEQIEREGIDLQLAQAAILVDPHIVQYSGEELGVHDATWITVHGPEREHDVRTQVTLGRSDAICH